jgi:hypothetical protein
VSSSQFVIKMDLNSLILAIDTLSNPQGRT